jgi:hypothetical protein
MTRSLLLVQSVLPFALGILMVVTTDAHQHWLTMGTAALAVAAVLLGVRWQRASILAVVLAALTIALSVTPPILAVSSGLCATGYLLTCHLRGPNTVQPNRITALTAIGIGLVTAATVVYPLDLSWLPLIAPIALFAAFVIAISPYLRYSRRS